MGKKPEKPFSAPLMRLGSEFHEIGHRILAAVAVLQRIGGSGKALEIYAGGVDEELRGVWETLVEQEELLRLTRMGVVSEIVELSERTRRNPNKILSRARESFGKNEEVRK